MRHTDCLVSPPRSTAPLALAVVTLLVAAPSRPALASGEATGASPNDPSVPSLAARGGAPTAPAAAPVPLHAGAAATPAPGPAPSSASPAPPEPPPLPGSDAEGAPAPVIAPLRAAAPGPALPSGAVPDPKAAAERALAVKRYQKSKWLLGFGISFLTLSAIATAGLLAALNDDSRCTGSFGECLGRGIGLGLAQLGIGVLGGVGLPLTIVGAVWHHKYGKVLRERRLRVDLHTGPRGASMQLTLGF